jgi:N-acetylmuramoyl-L-alanine amidase
MPTTGINHSKATKEAALAHARSRGAQKWSDVVELFDTFWLLGPKLNIRPEVPYGQWCDETATGTSWYWINHLNPGGLRITYAGEQSRTWQNGTQAALGMLHRLCLYIHGSVPEWFNYAEQYDPMPEKVAEAGYLGVAKKLSDLSGRWATNPKYAAQIVDHLNLAFPTGADVADRVTPPTTPAPSPDVPKSPYPAPPVQISLIPYANANRPKLEMPSPSYVTVHEVGNMSPGADEEMHRRFTHNGGGPSQVSFHFVVGPTQVIQLLPLDEAAWHASDGYYGTGNRDSIAIETIQIGDFNKTLWNLAWLINEINTNPNRFASNHRRSWDMSNDRIVQHNTWAPDKKNCPQFIRDRGLWPTLMQRVDIWEAQVTAPVAPQYARPVKYFWLEKDEAAKGLDREINDVPVHYLPLVYTAVQETPRRQATGTNRKIIGPPIKVGETFRADYVYRSGRETFVLTPHGTRVKAAHLLPKVQISSNQNISIRRTADAKGVLADHAHKTEDTE